MTLIFIPKIPIQTIDSEPTEGTKIEPGEPAEGTKIEPGEPVDSDQVSDDPKETIYLSGILSGDHEYSNVEIILNSDVQVAGNLKIGENVILKGQGYDLSAFGTIEINGNKESLNSDQFIDNLSIKYMGDSGFWGIDNYYLNNVFKTLNIEIHDYFFLDEKYKLWNNLIKSNLNIRK